MSEQGARAPDYSALFAAIAPPGLDPTLAARREGEMIGRALDVLREGSRHLAADLSAEEAARRQLELARRVFALAVDGIGALAAADGEAAERRFRAGLAELAAWAAEPKAAGARARAARPAATRRAPGRRRGCAPRRGQS